MPGSDVLLILLDFLLYTDSRIQSTFSAVTTATTRVEEFFKNNTAISIEDFNPIQNRFGSTKIFTRIKVDL